jgi:predicted RNase H-like HicB family nuclease
MKSARDYLQEPYVRMVVPVEPKGFHAQILEFPGCFAQGETVEEAYSSLESTAEAWIQSCLDQGQDIPEPSTSLTFSGRIVLRLPRGIHRQAAILAEQDETSLNTYLVSAVAAKVGAEDFYNVLAQRLEKHITGFANMAALYLHQSVTSAQAIERRKLSVDNEASTANAKG